MPAAFGAVRQRSRTARQRGCPGACGSYRFGAEGRGLIRQRVAAAVAPSQVGGISSTTGTPWRPEASVTRRVADGYEILAIRTRRKVPDLLAEALSLLEEKHGKV